MTAIRTDGPTPAGGDYEIAVFVELSSLTEVDEADATGIVVSEYTLSGDLVRETVAALAAR